MSAEGGLSSLRDRLAGNDPVLILGTVLALYALFGVFTVITPSESFVGSLVSNLRIVTFWAALYAMMVLALNLHWGYTGLFNIGVAGFMAVGVYTFAFLSAPPTGRTPGLGLPLWLGLIGATVAAGVVGAIAALPALRLRADYLAIVTLAMSEIIRRSLLASSLEQFTLFAGPGGLPAVTLGTGAGRGIDMPINPSTPVKGLFYTTPSNPASGTPTAFGEAAFSAAAGLGIRETTVVNWAYALVLVLVVVAFYWLLFRVGNSPFGRVLKAIREDEVAAQSLGKDTRVFKLKVFVLGCALMGLGGVLWEARTGFTDPTSNTFRPITTFYIFIALIIGGAGSNTGSVIGGSIFAAVLFQGPQFAARAIRANVGFESSPGTFHAAVGALFSGDLGAPAAYMLTGSQVDYLRFMILGVVLVYLIQNRPTGLLGHRNEVAASVDLSYRSDRSGEPGKPTATDGGSAGETDD